MLSFSLWWTLASTPSNDSVSCLNAIIRPGDCIWAWNRLSLLSVDVNVHFYICIRFIPDRVGSGRDIHTYIIIIFNNKISITNNNDTTEISCKTGNNLLSHVLQGKVPLLKHHFHHRMNNDWNVWIGIIHQRKHFQMHFP